MRQRRENPLKRLVAEMRAAAAQIEEPVARIVAAREAGRIPLTMVERQFSKRGECARLARKILSRLPELDCEERAVAARHLRGYAEILESRFEIASETRAGRRRAADDYAIL
jgi:hypothetical protein